MVRHGVMLFFFLFLLRVAWEHQAKGGGPDGAPSVEAYCPFGGVESLYQLVTTGGFIRRIEPSAMVLLGAVLLLTLVFSRGFCGWVCPFGSAQEWLGLAGRRIFGRRFNPDGRWEWRLRYLKYAVLAAVVALTWHAGALVFRGYDPFLAFFHLGKGVREMPWAYAALGVVLIGALKYERFFCKYACPLGAAIGIVGKFGLTRVTRNSEGCKNCNLCQKKCFAHIEVGMAAAVREAECNHCLECVAHCPKPDVLALRGAGWNFSHARYGALLVAGLLGTIGVSRAVGYWRTLPAAVAFTDAAGTRDPEQIRGWMTLEEVARGYGIGLERLYAGAGLPQKVAASTRLNLVAANYGLEFEPDRMRGVVAAILRGGTGGGAAQEVKGAEIRGFMTLNEIAGKSGIPAEWLRRRLELGADIDARQPVREWMHARGKSIADIRAALAEYEARRK